MSINHFINKIKSSLKEDYFIIIMYFLVVLGVSLSSFALGKFSVLNTSCANEVKTTGDNVLDLDISPQESQNNEEKVYVASRNGKSYYPLACSGAKRIKEENKIWFANKIEAEKSGYTLSSTCK